MLRLLEGKDAPHPFFHESIATRLYTLEELCYFMESSLYLVDSSWINEELFSWMEEELSLAPLADDLRQVQQETHDPFAVAERIFQDSDLYSPTEFLSLCSLLKQMRGKTKVERRKMSGDLFLEEKHYRQAAYIYLELLKEKESPEMTGTLKGNICHNLGVIYARMFLFAEAAEYFQRAYQLRKSTVSRDAYLFAMNFISDDRPMNEKTMDLNFTLMRDALNYLTRVADSPDYYVERKAAIAAVQAFDWKVKEEELLAGWKKAYKQTL